jgi:hypothetical protein
MQRDAGDGEKEREGGVRLVGGELTPPAGELTPPGDECSAMQVTVKKSGKVEFDSSVVNHTLTKLITSTLETHPYEHMIIAEYFEPTFYQCVLAHLRLATGLHSWALLMLLSLLHQGRIPRANFLSVCASAPQVSHRPLSCGSCLPSCRFCLPSDCFCLPFDRLLLPV